MFFPDILYYGRSGRPCRQRKRQVFCSKKATPEGSRRDFCCTMFGGSAASQFLRALSSTTYRDMGFSSKSYRRALSILNFQFDPGGLTMDFPVTSQTQMLAGILGSQLGF